MAENRANSEQYLLRLPDGMRDALKAHAEANNRSLNAEIVDRLQYTLDVKTITRQTVLEQAVSSLKEATSDLSQQTQVMKWMHEQQSVTMHMLETIAKTDGNLKPEFMEMLRGMLSRRGSDNGFPTLDEDKPTPAQEI